MERFWRSVLLNTGEYSGKPVQAHLGLADMSGDLFPIWLRLFDDTLAEISPSPEFTAHLQKRANNIAASLARGLEKHYLRGGKMMRVVLSTTTLMWAGICLGGNIIAAPAKFQVVQLTTAELLLIGRAQFAWLGLAEWGLLAILVAGYAYAQRLPNITNLIAVVIFLLQQLLLQPQLQMRSDQIVAGVQAPDSSLHIIFILAELLKWAFLTAGGILLLSSTQTARRTAKATLKFNTKAG
ncbi:group III truncated hemoglobin (plasmid) [Parasedimentitalea marina]|uniref:Group III truncated hemoglobin n=1 Tax=Parasedimentitalea marina TaxID=2483033 RepID=A0A3T0N9Y4_9RHOB|nr:group III truncated hemoglobin [Parasedimentitalea marina]AZV80823.1 group III truncated hemoglobin [Parasedimentitalea marina]